MWDSADLAEARRDWEREFFSGRAQVQEQNGDAWSLAGTYPYRLLPEASPHDGERGERPTAEMGWRLQLPWRATVAATNRVVLDDGQTFEVIDIDRGRSEAMCLAATCRRIV